MIQNGRNNGHENIEPHKWKPGQSGNPKGRPKTDSINGESLYEAIAKVAVQKALQGDRHFWQFVIDRCDGKGADALNQSGEVEGVVRYEDRMNSEN